MRMKEKTKKRVQGSISVLLVIILLPMMTFSAVIVDLSRINMAKQMISSAGDLTMNTALANYDTILKDVYGLFAMSQIEGWNKKELGSELNNYFAKTISSYGVISEEQAGEYVDNLIGDFEEILVGDLIDTTNFLEIDVSKLEINKVANSSLANASVLRKQIVEYMKYRAPLGVGLSFLDSLSAFEKVDDQNAVVEAQVAAQESTQDVTKACQKLITMIRDYDDRVAEINNALLGVASSTDTEVIPLEDYDSHVMKYESAWAENYKHINKLNLVFLANSPSVDGVYLKALSYPTELYVDYYGNVYSGEKDTGVKASPSLAGTTQDSKNQVDGQITNLNTNYKPLAEKYKNSMLTKDLFYNSNNINSVTIPKENEDRVIDNFIKFEKFLLNKSDNGGLTYSQVQDMLVQIQTLQVFLDNYNKYKGQDISAAEREQANKQTAYNQAVGKRDGFANKMYNSVTNINNATKSFVSAYEDEAEAVEFLEKCAAGKMGAIQSAITKLPSISGGYSGYYNANLAYGGWDKYIEYFDWLVNDSNFDSGGSAAQKKIIEHSRNYIASKGYDSNDYESYMNSKLDNIEKGNALYKLLVCLKNCHSYAKTYSENITPYNEAATEASEAYSELQAAIQKVARLKQEKEAVRLSVTGCLQQFCNFCANYQADAYYYNYHIQAAKNTIAPEALAIKTHYSQLLAYLKELRDDLEAISDQIGTDTTPGTVKGCIKAYNDNLEAWNTANTNYSSTNGSDSFSDQTAEDIEKAKTEYNSELYDTLDTFVISIWNEYDDLYTKLIEAANFTYGSKRIDTIATAEDVLAAVNGITLSEVVTIEEAEGKLEELYKAETLNYVPYTMDYQKQLGFLEEQILQIQALKYLNSTFPEEAPADAQSTKDEYKTAKNKLTGKDTTIDTSGSKNAGDDKDAEDMPEEPSGNFGYSYDAEGKKLGADLPSAAPDKKSDVKTKEVAEEKYKVSSTGEGDEERLNASDGVGSQTGKSNSVLEGIANVATTAVENLYILNYVFENFSYSTIVQEQIIKDQPLTSTSILGQMTEIQGKLTAENIAAAKEKTVTLSNFPIDEKHNYLYGAEIEYIMFGSSNPTSNVTSMRASIYALRFLFNCIFAFTDSEIRNSTMAAGLAVQAATLGIVPYQVVQIVLQLALAAAESAIDLSAMNYGLSVAIIKTKDTWSLSMSGASNALKDAGNAAAQMMTEKVTEGVTKAISSVTTGLNDLLDAGANELGNAITNVANSLETSAQGVLESVADEILTAVMTEIETGLNNLQYIDKGQDKDNEKLDALPTKEDVENQAKAIFQQVRSNLDGIINEACGGNEMALKVADTLKRSAEQMISEVEKAVMETIEKAEDVDITGYIAGKLNELKLMLIQKGNSFISGLTGTLEREARSAVDATKKKLEGYVTECGEQLTEEAAELIKTEITSVTNEFMDTTLKVNPTSTSKEIKASPLAMFKFGYKDYLMLLTYISICCGDSVLLRTADVIQMNLQHAGDGAKFDHKADKFLMSEAYTYVSVSATAELDMFFMDMSIFTDVVTDSVEVEGSAVDTSEEAVDTVDTQDHATQIIYKGLLGY